MFKITLNLKIKKKVIYIVCFIILAFIKKFNSKLKPFNRFKQKGLVLTKQ